MLNRLKSDDYGQTHHPSTYCIGPLLYCVSVGDISKKHTLHITLNLCLKNSSISFAVKMYIPSNLYCV